MPRFWNRADRPLQCDERPAVAGWACQLLAGTCRRAERPGPTMGSIHSSGRPGDDLWCDYHAAPRRPRPGAAGGRFAAQVN
jgi:hypothetical protein